MWGFFTAIFQKKQKIEPETALSALFNTQNGLWQNLPTNIYKKRLPPQPPKPHDDDNDGGATSSASGTTSTAIVETADADPSQQLLAKLTKKHLCALLELLQLGRSELKKRCSAAQIQQIHLYLAAFLQDNAAAQQSLSNIVQRSKFTFTLITSIALASIATDLSWYLFTLDAVAAALTSTLTTAVLTVTGTFSLFALSGFIGYFFVSYNLRKEEAKIRQDVLRKHTELAVLDSLLGRIQQKTQTIRRELGIPAQETTKTQKNSFLSPASAQPAAKKKKLLALIRSALVKPEHFEPTFIFLATTATMFFSYKASIITTFTVLGFAAGASFLSGPIGISLAITLALALAGFCAYRNYVSVMSVKRRATELATLHTLLSAKRIEYNNAEKELNDTYSEIQRLANQQDASSQFAEKSYLAHLANKYGWLKPAKKENHTEEDQPTTDERQRETKDKDVVQQSENNFVT